MKRKQDKLFNLTKFVKRFFVYDVEQGAIIYFQSQTDQKPSDIIPLSRVVEVRREEEQRVNSTANSKKKRKSVTITSAEKPKDWVHVLEVHTTSRVYRLFSDEYDVKEQWFSALDKFLLHRAHLEEAERLKI